MEKPPRANPNANRTERATRNNRRAGKVATELFLKCLSEGWSIRYASEKSGIPVTTAYDKKRSDPAFAALWDSAVERGTDFLEDEARSRAVDGTDKPVFYKGEVCGSIVEKSDFLLYKTLVSRRRDKWSERSPNDSGSDANITVRVEGGLPVPVKTNSDETT